jgi:hypothetical protein
MRLAMKKIPRATLRMMPRKVTESLPTSRRRQQLMNKRKLLRSPQALLARDHFVLI